MTRKRKSLKEKIASLSALGAGALVLWGGSAEANVIYTAVSPSAGHVGFGTGGNASYASPDFGPTGSQGFTFFRASFNRSTGTHTFHLRGIAASACGCFKFATAVIGASSLLRTFNVGAVWAPSFTGYARAPVGARFWGRDFSQSLSQPPPHTVTHYNTQGRPSFSDKYSLFKFAVGSDSYYGWIHLSFSVTGLFGNDQAFGPDLYIDGFAWNDMPNELIAAGDAPEPANFIPTGLAALALGATGLRRWRKTRKAA